MGQYIARRIVGLLPTVALLLFVVVILVDLIPGDIIDLILEEKFDNTETARIALERQLGLDKSLFVRYAEYAMGVLRGDFGDSLWTGQPVAEMIIGRSWVTIEIGILSIIIGATSGVAIGVVSAVRQDTPLDYFLRTVSILGISVPNFAIATAIVILPAVWFGTGPSLRYTGFTDEPLQHLKIILPPALVLATSLSASLMRITRTTMLDVLRQDYVRTAHAKGLTYRSVVVRHALKNSLIPVVTLFGLQVGFLIGGSVITESVFAIPGIGRLLIGAIANRDYPVVQGIVVIVGLFVMASNLLTDLSYAWLDPRIRYS